VNLFERLLGRPHRVIGGDCPETKGPLMYRWNLIRTRGFVLMVHCFLRSDMDRACHDHPWTFITLPLNSYIEHFPDGTSRRARAFIPLYRPAEWLHWVEVERPRTWTLVVRFRERRRWGFMTAEGWRHWKAYDYERDC
jgi:hypothetical protein